jgi:hypothetical protein
MLLDLLKFLLNERPDSYFLINEIVFIDSENSCTFLNNLKLNKRKLSNFIFYFLVKDLT